MTKPELKSQAIKLRKKGLSYSEILKEVPVAKSTLSRWLRDVGLAKKQKQRLTKKKRKAGKRGAEKRKRERVQKTKRIKQKASNEVKELISNSLWLSGVILYWAEGTKEKRNSTSQRVQFGNSDPNMIKTFLKWVDECLSIPFSDLVFHLYIHENADVKKSTKFWSDITGCKEKDIGIYLKTHNPKTNRKYNKNNYNGLLRIDIRKSTDLNRKIAGWIDGLCKYWGIV